MPKKKIPSFIFEKDGTQLNINHQARRMERAIKQRGVGRINKHYIEREPAFLSPKMYPWQEGEGFYIPIKVGKIYG